MMEKKNECDIVQDLLLSYCDDVLNPTSKKLVENHLKNCTNCTQKLNDIKNDMMQNQNKQSEEIDYLKKLRRKTRIKSILMALLIILFIFLVFYIYHFCIISSIISNSSESLSSQNFYMESESLLFDGNTAVHKLYFKDGKYKVVSERYSDNGKTVDFVKYGSVDSDEYLSVDENSKVVNVYKGEVYKLFNREQSVKSVPFVSNMDDVFAYRFMYSFILSISTDTFDVGREYYVLKNRFDKNQNWEVWVDKETGLTVREIQRNSVKSFFPGTDVTKDVRDSVTSYSYKFDVVTDEDVAVPSFDGYTFNEVEYSQDLVDSEN